jgi:hypothetical protein
VILSALLFARRRDAEDAGVVISCNKPGAYAAVVLTARVTPPEECIPPAFGSKVLNQKKYNNMQPWSRGMTVASQATGPVRFPAVAYFFLLSVAMNYRISQLMQIFNISYNMLFTDLCFFKT